MNPTEAVGLCRFVKAACPQQAIDEATPDAWGLLLADVRFEDAKAAVVNLARRQPFVAPAEIVAEVKRIRAERIRRFGHPVPPPELADDPTREQEWMREAYKQIGDGSVTIQSELHHRGELRHRPIAALLSGRGDQ